MTSDIDVGNRPRTRTIAASNDRRSDLQGMRAVAVCVVFADHLFGWPPGGFVGVDVFFVLSGFFITGLLIRKRTTDGSISFQSFYIRRVKRILPSALLVLVVTVIAAQVLFTAFRAKQTLVDALYSAVFAANFRFEFTGADYFQRGQPPSPLQHYWSLSIEEQFYFVWPALIVLIFALTRGYRRALKPRARQWALLGSMACLVGASFWFAMHLSVSDPNRAYFSSFTRVWELGVGALAAIAGPWLVRIPASVRPALAYLGISGVIASLVVIDSTVQFPAPWAVLPVLSTALVVAAFHGAEVRGVPLLTNPVARYLGDTSYTLYLWHWPVIILLQSVLPTGPPFYATAIAVAAGLTAVTYRFYENPIRQSNWLLGEVGPTNRLVPALKPSVWGLVGALGAMAIVIAICGIQSADNNSEVQKEIARATNQSAPLEDVASAGEKANPCFGAPAMVTPGCELRNPEAPLRPTIDSFAEDERVQQNCDMYDDHDRSCSYGYMGEDAVRIALVGDSHAQAILPALVPTLKPNKWQLTTYIGHQCILAQLPVGACDGALSKVEDALVTHPYDLVVVANFDYAIPPERYREVWKPIAEAGSRLMVLRDNPTTTTDAVACLTRVSFGGDRTGECGTPRDQAFARRETLPVAVEMVPGATLLDLSDYFCNSDRCPSVIGDVIVYRDVMEGSNSHMTATFAATLAPMIEVGLRHALVSVGG